MMAMAMMMMMMLWSARAPKQRCGSLWKPLIWSRANSGLVNLPALLPALQASLCLRQAARVARYFGRVQPQGRLMARRSSSRSELIGDGFGAAPLAGAFSGGAGDEPRVKLSLSLLLLCALFYYYYYCVGAVVLLGSRSKGSSPLAPRFGLRVSLSGSLTLVCLPTERAAESKLLAGESV